MKKIAFLAAIMVVGAGVAFASSLTVPFFNDTSTDNASGIAGRIGIKETSGSDRTISVVYSALSGSNVVDQPETFFLGAYQQIRWNPVQSNSKTEGPASAAAKVPNMTIGGTVGSAVISSAGTISGAYGETVYAASPSRSDSAYVLLP
jgi:hypothetical protein